MRILVTGANGQVGHALLQALAPARGPEGPTAATISASVGGPEGPTAAGSRLPPLLQNDGTPQRIVLAPPSEIIAATRDGVLDDGTVCERIDLGDLDNLRQALDRIGPDLIINAAAYTAVDRAEDEPQLAQRVNADAVGVLGEWAARHAARVIHFSTDYVFDGTASRPYREDDPTHPLGVYGRSKLAGEHALRASGARQLIFRTAWVYGARGHNFLRTMLRLGAERDELRVVDDQIGAPTPARLIADVTALAVARWYAAGADKSGEIDGTYHLVAAGQTSWCGFARAIFERAARAGLLNRIGIHAPRSPFVPKGEEERGSPSSLPHLPQEGGRAQRGGMRPRVAAITTADYPTKAVRPAYSVLDTAKLQSTFNIRLPDWQTALDGVIGELVV